MTVVFGEEKVIAAIRPELAKDDGAAGLVGSGGRNGPQDDVACKPACSGQRRLALPIIGIQTRQLVQLLLVL